ncbi:Pol protein, partial [Globisporangium splendens]
MEGVDVPLGPAVPETVELTNEYFPHLSSYEWSALERMRNVIGEAAVISLLRSASPEDQKNAAVSFMHHEIIESRKQVATPVSSFRTVPLKLDVSPYRGGENEPLSRWFVELDAATTARQLRDPMQQVLFAMSNLAGRAKSWAYGKRLSDPNCFYSYEDFKAELKAAFEPPQSEFRARAEFLKLRRGRFDLHSYAQRARFLVSSIVDEPIDVPTQVVTFMTGLNDGPIRNQLFREYPKTLDEAISRAMQEEFSIKQAKFQGFPSRPPRQANVAHDGPEPMDISYISTPGNGRPHNDVKCFRCGKSGHFARNCKVSLPDRQTTQGARSSNHDRSHGRRFDRSPGPKNGNGQTWPNVRKHMQFPRGENSVSQTSSLIVHKVQVDGIATPLRALVDTDDPRGYCVVWMAPHVHERYPSEDDYWRWSSQAPTKDWLRAIDPKSEAMCVEKKRMGKGREPPERRRQQEEVGMIVDVDDAEDINTVSATEAEVFDEKTRKERFEEQSWDALKTNPVYELVKEYEDIFPDKVPDELPFDRGVRHEIDILPGTKYCITRQWPLPREQVVAIEVLCGNVHKGWAIRNARDGVHDCTFQIMRENKLYANLKKCIFFAPEIPVLGCFVGKSGVRVDPEKVKAVDDWPVPQNVKQLRQWLGLANYLHKYTRNYAALVQPLTQLLKKDIEWEWSSDHQMAFAEVKRSLREAPVLAIANHDKPFHVVCDASDYAIGCALMQHDDEGHERVVSYQSRQLRPAERNYPVHDKELLAMKYSLVKFRVYLLGEERFAIYTDHASLRTAVKTPHLSQRMARWFSFFAEYNFVVHYKPGKTNILADALSRRPDYDPKTKSEDTDGACRLCEDIQAIAVQATTTVREDIVEGYKSDETCQDLLKYFKDPSDKALQGLPSRTRSRVHRFRVHNGLLYYAVEDGDTARVVVPNDEGLRHRLLYEYHGSPSGGHLGREKTFLSLSRDYYWPHMYKWVRKYVRTCEICQRVKPSGSTQAPLRSLAVPSDSWKSVSMDFIFGLPRDKHGRNGILVFVDRFSKMVHLAPVSDKISAEMTAKVFVDVVFRLHGLPVEIVSDRDTRFTSKFWRALFGLLDTKLSMSTAAHPETDGQTERVNRVLEDVLRSYATSFKEWSEFLPLAEFALNNSTHVSTGHSPFYVNYGIHPRVPASIMGEVSTLSGGGTTAKGNKPQSSYDLNAVAELKANFDSMKPLNDLTSREEQQVDDFIVRRQAVVRFVRDAIAKAQDLQKEQADKSGRKNKQVYKINDLLEASAKVHWTVQGG